MAIKSLKKRIYDQIKSEYDAPITPANIFNDMDNDEILQRISYEIDSLIFDLIESALNDDRRH